LFPRLLTGLLIVSAMPIFLFAQEAASIPEEIEWTWEVRPTSADAKLPNVLLIGDSITRDYFPAVTRLLAGRANVYLIATSACVGDPRLPRQIDDFSALEGVHFSLVHFNNGMHGWAYSESEYKNGFSPFLRAIKASAPGARLVWATTTPVKTEASPGPTNSRIDSRNAIANEFVKKDGIAVDDQHELMAHHPDMYQDSVHFNGDGAELQAAQVVGTINSLLTK